MLYTGKGDNGKTGTFGTKEKLSKSSSITHALGALDEANSYIGMCKALAAEKGLRIENEKISDIMHREQNNLFIVQAQVAGADKKLSDTEVAYLETIIGIIEKTLPPIKSFLIPGANIISAHCDIARTLARKAERRVVLVSEQYPEKISAYTLAYLNRLSSLFYAFARFTAAHSDTAEVAPTY